MTDTVEDFFDFDQMPEGPEGLDGLLEVLCAPGRRDGAFAFSILSELLMAAIFIFSVFYLLGAFPRSIYGPTLSISCVIFLLFAIIQFSVLGDGCISIAKQEYFGRTTHAFITAVRNMLIFSFLLLAILYNKFGRQGDLLFRDSVPAAKQDPAHSTPGVGATSFAATTNTTTTVPQHTVLAPMQPAIMPQAPVVPQQQPMPPPPPAPVPAPVAPPAQQAQ